MMNSAAEVRSRLEAALQNRIPRALTPPERATPEMMPTGIASVDALTGGVPLGCLTEICGASSSGRTSVLLALIAECMQRNEICALVDASDAFDPQSAASMGVDLTRLLWIRCSQKSGHRAIGSSGEVKSHRSHNRTGRFSGPTSNSADHAITRASTVDCDVSEKKECNQLEQALKTTDLLLQAGGFGLVVLDLGDISVAAARRIPLTTWFRFRRAVENTATAFIVLEQQPHAKSCASLVLDFAAQQTSWSETAGFNGSITPAHEPSITSAAPLDGVSFHVTAQGIAIPFHKSTTSSFETPQRWISPRGRLLNTVHVHLQLTRSRMAQSSKLPIRGFTPINHFIHHGDTEARSRAM